MISSAAHVHARRTRTHTQIHTRTHAHTHSYVHEQSGVSKQNPWSYVACAQKVQKHCLLAEWVPMAATTMQRILTTCTTAFVEIHEASGNETPRLTPASWGHLRRRQQCKRRTRTLRLFLQLPNTQENKVEFISPFYLTHVFSDPHDL